MPLIFTVGEIPKTKPFQFADLAELLILTGTTSQISKADLSDLIQTGSLDSDPDGHENYEDNPLSLSASYDRNIEDCFQQFRYRTSALGESYPFELINGLLTRRSSISIAGYVYLFCLVCSRLASFDNKSGFRQNCASIFTELSSQALKLTLKDSARVYIFDAGSIDRKVIFDSNLKLALPKLAQKLNARPDMYVIEQQSTSGDGGIDLVAINSMGDSANGILIYFAQCAAQKDGWPDKTLETRRSSKFFSLSHDASNMLYTPVLYRNASGQWVNEVHSADCIIVDRLRIMHAVQDSVQQDLEPAFSQFKSVVDDVAQSETA